MTTPNKPEASRPGVYVAIFELLHTTARKLGYALAIHGSLARDFDLIAVPWTEEATDDETLAKALTETSGGWLIPDGTRGGRYDKETDSFHEAEVRNPGIKPHGRRAWTIQLGGGAFIDLSVMPRAPQGTKA